MHKTDYTIFPFHRQIIMAKTHVIQSEEVGQRIDNFIFKHLKSVPKVRVYRAFRHGEIRVNKGRIKPDYRLQLHDEVRIPPLQEPRSGSVLKLRDEVSLAIRQSIVYEDDGLIVMDKPPGLPVHGGSGIRGGVIELLRLARPELRYLELVHRLDRETSGCLLLAKRRKTLLMWHEYLTKRRVHKQYLTLVKGRWSGGKRTVDAPLIKNILSSGERLVKVAEEGKQALTIFNPIKLFDNMSLVEACPQTGRTHQIRVHLQYIGHPVAGDPKYGDAEFNKQVKRGGLKRLFLHSASISSPDFGLCVPLAHDLSVFLAGL
jgi:23S rRNA pseudouridine955/2504/2580 synthase